MRVSVFRHDQDPLKNDAELEAHLTLPGTVPRRLGTLKR